MKPFPMPNDRLTPLGEVTERIVVASVEYRDEPTMIALVLLLRPVSPFFEVAHFYMEDAPEEETPVYHVPIPARAEGAVHVLATHFNIVTAVREYEQSGGDI